MRGIVGKIAFFNDHRARMASHFVKWITCRLSGNVFWTLWVWKPKTTPVISIRLRCPHLRVSYFTVVVFSSGTERSIFFSLRPRYHSAPLTVNINMQKCWKYVLFLHSTCANSKPRNHLRLKESVNTPDFSTTYLNRCANRYLRFQFETACTEG